jgi:hypothetical protein
MILEGAIIMTARERPSHHTQMQAAIYSRVLIAAHE